MIKSGDVYKVVNDSLRIGSTLHYQRRIILSYSFPGLGSGQSHCATDYVLRTSKVPYKRFHWFTSIDQHFYIKYSRYCMSLLFVVIGIEIHPRPHFHRDD